MWTGGTIPLGFDVENRKLVVNPKEAERVKHIFQRYLELGNLNDLYQDLNRRNVKGKPRKLKNGLQEPGPFGSSTIQYLLSNPTYIGKVRHKGHIYEGQHEPIIPMDLWQEVQDRLTSQSMTMRNHKKHKQKNLLRGLMFDQSGVPYVPTYSNKPGRQYRYYKLKEKAIAENTIDRLPAHEIENRVEQAVRQELADFNRAAAFLGIDPLINPDLVQIVNRKQACLPGKELILASVQKVIVDHDSIAVHIRISALSEFIAEHLQIGLPIAADEIREIKTSYITRRAHRGSIIIEADKTARDKDSLDLPPGELRNLVRGLIWRDEHFSGTTLRDIAKREEFSEGYIGQCIFRTFEISLT